MGRLNGRRAVVTGGAQGIGAAIARRLAAEGATVAVLDLDGDRAAAVLAAPHIGIACDIRDTAAIDAAFAQIRDRLGGIDVLVNNAGRGSAPGDGMAEYYAALARQGEGEAVFADQTIHCSDEGWAAVLGMTRAMARELAPRGIRVNAVNPGATETPVYATLPAETRDAIAADSLMKRLAHPDEIAGAVAFLAGDDGSFATGSIVTVNGGAYFT